MGEEFAGSEKLGLAPKVLRVLLGSAEPFSTGFLLCETFRRNFLQNPKGSVEFWGAFGSPDPSFGDRPLFLPIPNPGLLVSPT